MKKTINFKIIYGKLFIGNYSQTTLQNTFLLYIVTNYFRSVNKTHEIGRPGLNRVLLLDNVDLLLHSSRNLRSLRSFKVDVHLRKPAIANCSQEFPASVGRKRTRTTLN